MNHTISLEKAIQMTTLYRQQKEIILGSDFQGKNILHICETFNREAFDKVLAQPGCVGLRIYHGMNEDLQIREIIVGVNVNNEDMLPALNADGNTLNLNESITPEPGNEKDDNTIIEEGSTCPPMCPPPSPLKP